MLRSEMHALVTISNVWNSEEVKKCLGEAFYFGFSMGRPVWPWFIFWVSARQIPSFLAKRRWPWKANLAAMNRETGNKWLISVVKVIRSFIVVFNSQIKKFPWSSLEMLLLFLKSVLRASWFWFLNEWIEKNGCIQQPERSLLYSFLFSSILW